jgi:hypothetical protein
MIKNRWWWIVAMLSAAALVACGDSTDNDGDGPDDGGAGSSGTGSDGGAGMNSAGTGGSSGTAGTAGTAPVAMPVPCGDIMCNPPANPAAGLLMGAGGLLGGGGGAIPMGMACCIDEAAEECGYTAMAGGMCEPPATEDMRCDGIDTSGLQALADMFGFGALVGQAFMGGFGCCTDDNQCGVDGALFGRGCVANVEAMAMLGAIPLVGGAIEVPVARSCDDPGDSGAHDDAGE